MKKKILVIYYSQTGQLRQVVNNLIKPAKECDLDFYQIRPQKDYGFPWKSREFFDVFPESFQQVPAPIEPPPEKILNGEYDLILLAYQIWFLSPSIPINSFLKSKYASSILNNNNIITIIGCRNMWAKAQQKTAALIHRAGGQLVGNMAFVDRSPNLISVVTIVHWVMGGEKTRKYGIFPLPGISKEDIESAARFWPFIQTQLENEKYDNLQKNIIAKGGTNLKPFIIFMDEKANRMFRIWAKFIRKKQKRRQFKLKCFKYYLFTALFIISPIVYLLFLLTYPLRTKRIKRKRRLYQEV